ncbi:MAG: hypothetical protein K8T91_24920 [Planctomycetes bacterium]|nr:hypothetical protein [Planctomycetota bacterium]
MGEASAVAPSLGESLDKSNEMFMRSESLTERFSISALFLAGVALLFVGCRERAQPLLTNGLQLRIVRHETDFMRGGNFIMTQGVEEFIFYNRGTAPVTMVFPPVEIVEFTSNTRRTLPESDWPGFAKKPSTLTLVPQEKRVFHTDFSVGTKDRRVPVLRFIFRIPTNQRSDFADSVTSEGKWDTSKTKEYVRH